MPQLGASLAEDSRGVKDNCNMFIIQATELRLESFRADKWECFKTVFFFFTHLSQISLIFKSDMFITQANELRFL
jgi:hypothetical protein